MRLSIRNSTVCPGLGLFTEEPIEEGSFVGVYFGEWISPAEEEIV